MICRLKKWKIRLHPRPNPHPLTPCSVMPLFELPVGNNKSPTFEWRGGGMGVEERGNLGNILDTGARAFWETLSKGLFERKKQGGTLVYIVIVTGLFVLYQVIKPIPRNTC